MTFLSILTIIYIIIETYSVKSLIRPISVYNADKKEKLLEIKKDLENDSMNIMKIILTIFTAIIATFYILFYFKSSMYINNSIFLIISALLAAMAITDVFIYLNLLKDIDNTILNINTKQVIIERIKTICTFFYGIFVFINLIF